jgi:hypothetical protein
VLGPSARESRIQTGNVNCIAQGQGKTSVWTAVLRDMKKLLTTAVFRDKIKTSVSSAVFRDKIKTSA